MLHKQISVLFQDKGEARPLGVTNIDNIVGTIYGDNEFWCKPIHSAGGVDLLIKDQKLIKSVWIVALLLLLAMNRPTKQSPLPRTERLFLYKL